MWCFAAYFLSMKSPPAPVSRRTLVTTVLFPPTVLHVMGIERCIDLDPMSATSTEEILSVSNVVVGRSSKNPRLQILHIISPFLLAPCLQSGFESGLVQFWRFSCILQSSDSVFFLSLGLGSPVPGVLFRRIRSICLLPCILFVRLWIVCPRPLRLDLSECISV